MSVTSARYLPFYPLSKVTASSPDGAIATSKRWHWRSVYAQKMAGTMPDQKVQLQNQQWHRGNADQELRGKQTASGKGKQPKDNNLSQQTFPGHLEPFPPPRLVNTAQSFWTLPGLG